MDAESVLIPKVSNHKLENPVPTVKANTKAWSQHVITDSGTESKDLAVKKPLRHTGDVQEQIKSRWPRGIRRGFAAARLLGLRVRHPSGAWMSVCCECCVLSGTGLSVRLITRALPGEVCLSVIAKPRKERP